MSQGMQVASEMKDKEMDSPLCLQKKHSLPFDFSPMKLILDL